MNKLAVTVVFICLISACNYSRYRHTFFEGNWVLINYLDTVQKYRSVARARHTGMQEIVLKRHTDSVHFWYEGREGATFPFVEKTSNQLLIPQYADGRPLSLFINEYAYYLSYDKDSVRYVFVKPEDVFADSSSGWPVTTQRVINSLVLGGIYRQAGRNGTVQFHIDGRISGLPEFSQYEVCTGNACRRLYESDVLTLGDEPFTWEWQDRQLSIYRLEPSAAAGTTRYQKGDLYLTLTKWK